MVFYFSGTGNSKYAARRARASAQNGAACTGCIRLEADGELLSGPLPRRCLHGVHHPSGFVIVSYETLCLGATCTGCIGKS